MSIARQLLNEFRPLFRMLEEPITRSPALRYNSIFNDPFFNSPALARPAVDVSEEGNKYIIEAELPGVPKENVDVRIGNHGHSVTIEGKVTNRRGGPASAPAPENGNASETTAGDTTTTVTNQAEPNNQLSTERQLINNTSFTRTVWLSRPVDGSTVTAQLKDGVLTLSLPKSEDKGSVKISVD
ncbi:HSP20-like chaperone [Lentinula aff. detonsa]|uniref:HSP20-like chaperone n=2 Tax=Lentinula TaxID=5352 RepID=A0AA38KRY6_9AGAR|nr:HSP20-like chaperone [Lentinula aff. detonsa]KAJ3989793.1 HSP20-like chaperone [Lentinula detonsa]